VGVVGVVVVLVGVVVVLVGVVVVLVGVVVVLVGVVVVLVGVVVVLVGVVVVLVGVVVVVVGVVPVVVVTVGVVFCLGAPGAMAGIAMPRTAPASATGTDTRRSLTACVSAVAAPTPAEPPLLAVLTTGAAAGTR
jgi:hypothetical protein